MADPTDPTSSATPATPAKKPRVLKAVPSTASSTTSAESSATPMPPAIPLAGSPGVLPGVPLAKDPAQIAAEERQHAALAASSPLAMIFELVSCQLASTQPVEGSTIPSYHFHTRCPFGKLIPDQDCRDCAHVAFIPVGQAAGPANHRYFRRGMVIPVTEAVADKVIEVCAEEGTGPLLRPQWTEDAAEQARRLQQARAAQAQQQELERRQIGPYGKLPG